jgi:MFS family permease
MEGGPIEPLELEPDKFNGHLKHTFRALSEPNFRYYYTGQLISLSGTWMQNLALSWLVYRLTNSSMQMGKVDFCQQMPVLALALVGGWLADKVDRRFILATSHITMMLQSAALAYLVYSQKIEYWQILCLAAVTGLVNAFEMPARQSLIGLMVERKFLVNAISLNSSAVNASKVVGPALAAFIVGMVGEAWCFAFNSVSYIGALVALFMIKLPQVSAETKKQRHNFLDGIKFAIAHKEIGPLLRLTGTMSLLGAQFFLLLPIVAREILHRGVESFGLLRSSAAIGSLIGALFLANRGSQETLHKIVRICSLIFPAALILFSLSHELWLSVPLMMVLGWSLTSQLSGSNSLLQLNCPEHLRGRIMSLWTLTFMGMSPIGSLLTGYLASKIGVMNTMSLSGITCLISALVFVLFKK